MSASSLGIDPLLTHVTQVSWGSVSDVGALLVLAAIGVGCLGTGLILVCARVLLAQLKRRGAGERAVDTGPMRVPAAAPSAPPPTPLRRRSLPALPPAADDDEAPTSPGRSPVAVAELVQSGEWQSTETPAHPYAMRLRDSRSEAGESWLKEYMDRLRRSLPGIPEEGPEMASLADATLEIDQATLCRMIEDLGDPAQLLSAPSAVQPAAPRVSPDRTVRLPAMAQVNGPPNPKTLILGSLAEVPGYDAGRPSSKPRPAAPSSSGVVATLDATGTSTSSTPRDRDLSFQYGARRA
jgi:hypothetical protein